MMQTLSETTQNRLFSHLCKYLLPAPAQVLQVGDSSKRLANHLIQAGYDTVSLKDASYLTNHHAKYDIVILYESLHLLTDLHAALSHAWDLLVPNGRLLICNEVKYDLASVGDVCHVHKIEEVIGLCNFHVQAHEDLTKLVWPELQDTAQIGYELWSLRPNDLQTSTYRPHDEKVILQTFQEVFQAERSRAHWDWKFSRSPFGGPSMANIWDGETIAAHYAGYPVPLWLRGRDAHTYHAGDTFTHPKYRGIGRGPSSLLARAFRHFERHYFERQIPFAYGFNTDKILKFGQLFLGYHAPVPVYEWHLSEERLNALKKQSRWGYRQRGYRVLCTEQPDIWADLIFEQARERYDWLTARTQSWLKWRYQQNPDFQYQFFVVKHWGQPVGWWLGRIENNTLMLGDALFTEAASSYAIQNGLQAAIQFFGKVGDSVDRVQGWFSQTPAWWGAQLHKQGFVPQRQFQNLHLCVKPFEEGLTPEEIAWRFYFTWGDSDLY
ncbi:MAG: GNAT family N-acetyltransferase [Pseudomonadota bacterium]